MQGEVCKESEAGKASKSEYNSRAKLTETTNRALAGASDVFKSRHIATTDSAYRSGIPNQSTTEQRGTKERNKEREVQQTQCAATAVGGSAKR